MVLFFEFSTKKTIVDIMFQTFEINEKCHQFTHILQTYLKKNWNVVSQSVCYIPLTLYSKKNVEFCILKYLLHSSNFLQ